MSNRLIVWPATALISLLLVSPAPRTSVGRGVEGRIELVGRMRLGRSAATATAIATGRVLIVGGYNGSYLRSAIIFDPTSSRFSAAGSMTIGRSDDGWSFLASAELFDPKTGRFTPVRAMSVARESHTASLLRDGRVLIAGGHRDRRENIVVYANAEIYDPVQRAFAPAPSMTTARHKHEAISLDDGRVLVLGGSDSHDRTHFTSAEVFDPATNRWSAISSMRVGRYKLRDTALRLSDRRVLIAGSGRFAEVFDPRTSTFSSVEGDFGEEYSFASAVLLGADRALVLGGYDDAGHNTDGIWRYRP